MLSRKWIFIIPALCISTLACAGSSKVQSEEVKYIRNLVKTEKYQAVLDEISGGNRAAIALAPLLKPGVDASTYTGLIFALSRALPVAADDVLSLVPDSFPMEQICTVPYIEAEPAVEKRYLDSAIASVAKAKKSTMQKQCLGRLQSIKKKIQ